MTYNDDFSATCLVFEKKREEKKRGRFFEKKNKRNEEEGNKRPSREPPSSSYGGSSCSCSDTIQAEVETSLNAAIDQAPGRAHRGKLNRTKLDPARRRVDKESETETDTPPREIEDRGDCTSQPVSLGARDAEGSDGMRAIFGHEPRSRESRTCDIGHSQLLTKSHKFTVGTLNIRTARKPRQLANLVGLIESMKLDITVVCESQMETEERLDNYQILNATSKGIKIILSKRAQNSLIKWTVHQERIISCRLFGKHFRITVIGVYWPANNRNKQPGYYERFSEELDTVISRVPVRDMLLICGDFNCTGPNRELLETLAHTNDLCVGQWDKFKYLSGTPTWRHPNAELHGNVLDLIIIRRRYVNMMEAMGVKDPRPVETDHRLVWARIGLHICKGMGLPDRAKAGQLIRRICDSSPQKQRLDQMLEAALEKDSSIRSPDGEWDAFRTQLEHAIRDVEKMNHRNNTSRPTGRKERRSRMATAIQDMTKCRVTDDKAMWKILQDTFKVRSVGSTIPKSLTVKKLGDYMSKDLYGVEPTEPVICGEEGGMPATATDQDHETKPLDIQLDEVTEAIKRAKNKISCGVDGLPAEILKIGTGMAKRIHRVCQACFEAERLPRQWNISKVTPIYKCGNKSDCPNYRTILSQCAAAKIFSTIILARMYPDIDKTIDNSQVAFRRGRSGLEVIHATQLLIDKCNAFELPLTLTSTDFRKAFDKISRDHVYESLRLARVHPKYIRIVRNCYESAKAMIRLHRKERTIDLKSGLRQGDCWSPLLFICGLDRVLSQRIRESDYGFRLLKNIQPKRYTRLGIRDQDLGPYLNELSFADDVTLPAATIEGSDQQISYLEEDGRAAKLVLAPEKCKRLCINIKSQDGTLARSRIECTDKLNVLGAIIDGRRGNEAHIERRIKLAGQRMARLQKVWSSHDISLRQKFIILWSVVFSVLLYASECLALSQREIERYCTFYNKCIRRVLRISPLSHTTNREIWSRSGCPDCHIVLRMRRLRWYGHILRASPASLVNRLLLWDPAYHLGAQISSRRRRGWIDIIAEDLRAANLSKANAQDRSLWERRIKALRVK